MSSDSPRERQPKAQPPLVIVLRSDGVVSHAVSAGSSETPALHKSPESALIEEAIR